MAALDARGANILNPTPPAVVLTAAQDADYDLPNPLIAAESLHIHDVSILYFDKNGVPIVELINQAESKISHRTESFPDGRNFRVTIDNDDIPMNARYMTSSLPAGAFQNAEPDAIQAAHLDKDKGLKTNKVSEIPAGYPRKTGYR